MNYQLKYQQFGEKAILIEWPSIIDENVLKDVLHLKFKIEWEFGINDITSNHAYCSILVQFLKGELNFEVEVERIKLLYETEMNGKKGTSRKWKVPVCYEFDYGIDLKQLSEEKKLTVDEVIQLHTGALYTVYFIGFLPGFLYLGGLNEKLFTPRKETPRLSIEKGAVAIGGEQTGIYPSESPGGWHIIGNSPIHFFDASKKQPCFVNAGDKIEFVSVSIDEYNKIKKLVEIGVYQLENAAIND